ncbi:unnamed protein product [Prorocentrum cordatum]|uniref:Uncharacterized protein n=1 Tax=Prorocentrum cordatum TaxID=2364126 RepID=A0ABN9VHA4_9DINO|nr:unnamed protein product [Polarella glacialis]
MVAQGQEAAAAQAEKMTLDLQALEASKSTAQAALDEERERAKQLSSRCKELEQLSSNSKADLAQAQERYAEYETMVAQGQDAAAAQAEKMTLDLQALEASKKLAQAQDRAAQHEAMVAQAQDAAAAQAAAQVEKMTLDLQALEASKTSAQAALDEERERAKQLSSRCKDLEQLSENAKAELALARADLAAAEDKATARAAVAPVEAELQQSSAAPVAQEAKVLVQQVQRVQLQEQGPGPEAVRRELQEQLEQAAAAQERLREGLEKAEAEVAASRDHGSAASERAAQAEAELAREKEKVRAELERLQQAERARAELESRLAEAERGVRAAGAAEVADLDARVQGLRDELKAEQERGAKLLEAQQQMAGALASGEGLRNELVELETLRVQGDSTLDRATRAEAELEQERQRAAAETKRAREAADAKAFLEGKLAQVESDRVSKESSLRAAERKLQEQEQMLGHTQELKRRLGDLEPKLAALEQRREGASSTAQEDARVADLEQRLAEAAELQSQLQRRLASAEQELNSTKAMSEDFKAFAAQAEAALAEERKKQEKTEQEIMESSTRRDEAITANSKLEAKLLELERKFKAQERHVLPVEAPEMQAAARADVAAGAASMQQPLEQVNLVEKKLKAKPGDVAPVLCSFKVESLDHQQLMEDRNLKAAFEASVKQTLASEAGGLVSKSQIQLVLTAGSVVVEASIEHAPGVDLGAVAQRLGSSLTLARKVAAYIGALDGMSDEHAINHSDGIHRISSGPIKVTNISVTHGSDPKPTAQPMEGRPAQGMAIW